jgi:histidyl-tRNA synthetase
MGPMFRHERPQKGRDRQFNQIGVEALGFPGPDIDAEIIVMCARLWRQLGISDVQLQINTLGDPEARLRYRARLVAYLERHIDALDEDARRRMHSNPLRVLDSKNPAMQPLIDAAPKLVDDLDEGSLRHFELVQSMLRRSNVSFAINPRLVRGLDYYNRTVFEWITSKLGAQAAVCAGGRYDGLVEQLGGKPSPACGFALGIERLLALLEVEKAVIPARLPDIYVVHQGEAAATFAWDVCERLREHGLDVLMHCGGGNFKSQMRKADGSGARFAVIVGDDEVAAGQVSLKPLRETSAQTLVDVAEVARLVGR